MSRQRQDMPPSSLLLTEAVISRLAREFPSCESCPRREHLRLILLAEISKVDKTRAVHTGANKHRRRKG